MVLARLVLGSCAVFKFGEQLQLEADWRDEKPKVVDAKPHAAG